MASLATLAQVRGQLKLAAAFTDDDAWLTQELDAVSDDIENYCNRALRRASYTLVLDAPDGASLELGRYAPIESVASIKEASDRDFSSATALVEGTDFLVYSSNYDGRIERIGTWLNGSQVIEIVFTGGFVTPDATPTGDQVALPEAIVGACIYEVIARYRNRGHEGQRSEAGEGGSMTLYETGGLSQATKDRLAKFRRLAIG